MKSEHGQHCFSCPANPGCPRTDLGLGGRIPSSHHFGGGKLPAVPRGGTAKAPLSAKPRSGNSSTTLTGAPADAENSWHAVFGDVTGPALARVMSTSGLLMGGLSLTLQSTRCSSAQAAASQVKTLNCRALLGHLRRSLRAATVGKWKKGSVLSQRRLRP